MTIQQKEREFDRVRQTNEMNQGVLYKKRNLTKPREITKAEVG